MIYNLTTVWCGVLALYNITIRLDPFVVSHFPVMIFSIILQNKKFVLSTKFSYTVCELFCGKFLLLDYNGYLNSWLI